MSLWASIPLRMSTWCIVDIYLKSDSMDELRNIRGILFECSSNVVVLLCFKLYCLLNVNIIWENRKIWTQFTIFVLFGFTCMYRISFWEHLVNDKWNIKLVLHWIPRPSLVGGQSQTVPLVYRVRPPVRYLKQLPLPTMILVVSLTSRMQLKLSEMSWMGEL